MPIRVALNHRTSYSYDRHVNVGPQVVRLRPAPHCRTPILSYSLKIQPEDHFINWQQDPFGNYLARLVFQERTDRLSVEVDLVADMTVINPFDFFVESYAEELPFEYDDLLARELRPFLETSQDSDALTEYVKACGKIDEKNTILFLCAINQKLYEDINYLIRMEPGIQTPEETLTKRSGSCRDSAWLMVQILRRLGLAARFASGYLIQLEPDVKAIDGPAGPTSDFTDLHAWTEVFLPGAGWVGLDPTSGLLAGEGHIPLACTPDPQSAAPISGGVDKCEVEFGFDMKVTRIVEDPRVTKPYTDGEWASIDHLGRQIDERLEAGDVRLTMGGEPTFVSIDDMEGEEWNSSAVGPTKRRLSGELLQRMRKKFAPGGLLHYGQGKWYPGESLPRWALSCYWRKDGEPIWHDVSLIADEDRDYGFGVKDAEQFVKHLAGTLGVVADFAVPAYEDVAHYVVREQRLPVNVDPTDSKLKDPEERARLAHVFGRGLDTPTGFVMPLKRQWWQARPKWTTGPWPVRPEKMFLLPGDSPVGLRLPLDALPYAPESTLPPFFDRDPLEERDPLPTAEELRGRDQPFLKGYAEAEGLRGVSEQPRPHTDSKDRRTEEESEDDVVPEHVVRTAICVEPRAGKLYVFMPPVEYLEDYLDLVAAIEQTAKELKKPVIIEGYLPPFDDRIEQIKVTPDPGVVEVNVHPAHSWDELADNTTSIYEMARETRLGTEKFDLDGSHTGTGGGNHIVLGASKPSDSPFLRRPDLLKSLIGYWNNHPALSYLFSGKFIGPTCQAPRVDEGRKDAIYELKIAFEQIPPRGQDCPAWLVDRIFRNLLVDLTGNTHRAEFCIDKLYSPDSATGRLGLLELRGFEMPPHSQMSLTQQLLIRGLIAMFWEKPWDGELADWGMTLHDRFLLPYFVRRDMSEITDDLRQAGFEFDVHWFAPHFEFRFPKIGDLAIDDVRVELRTAIEPWNVLGEEPGASGTVRYVDASVERLQVFISGLTDGRYAVTCNGRRVPLTSTGTPGEYVAGVRYRAWQPPACLHPTIPVHTPLVFDICDLWQNRSICGCTYHVSHPGGRSYDTFPVNANEAESRRVNRFYRMGHTPGTMPVPEVETNSHCPLTLDLRR